MTGQIKAICEVGAFLKTEFKKINTVELLEKTVISEIARQVHNAGDEIANSILRIEEFKVFKSLENYIVAVKKAQSNLFHTLAIRVEETETESKKNGLTETAWLITFMILHCGGKRYEEIIKNKENFYAN